VDILYRASLPPEASKIPSWIPDWSTPVLPALKNTWLGTYDTAVYHAAGDSGQRVRIGEHDDVLTIAGGLVDTIEHVCTGSVINISMGELTPSFANYVLNEVDRIFDDLSSYPTGESLFSVKWRSLIGNKTVPSQDASKEYDAGFKAAAAAPKEYGVQYKSWRERMKGISIAVTAEGPTALYTQSSEGYFQSLVAVSKYKLCKTQSGYVGLVPLCSVVGDRICVFLGAAFPSFCERAASALECSG
jgi:hypothetical protein